MTAKKLTSISFVTALAGTAISAIFAGRSNLFTGMLAGSVIALAAVFQYILFIPHAMPASKGQFIKKYLLSMTIRFLIVIIIFCLFVFLLKVSAIGLTAGLGIAMVIINVMALIKLKAAATTTR
jgi:hypothetical protein